MDDANKQNINLRLTFIDRVGIAADVAALMSAGGINLTFFEMDVKGGRATIFLTADGPAGTDWALHIDRLRNVPGLEDVALVQSLPYEEREKRLQFTLDSISDGILGIDNKGVVVIINQVAEKILGCHGCQVIGKKVSELNLLAPRLDNCLSDEPFTNVKKTLVTPDGRFQFLATGKPIKNSDGRTVGAVEIMKDMREIKALSSAVVHPDQFSFGDMIGNSSALSEAISVAQKVALTDSIITICGESGTGKELFANAIHSESGRRGPFLPINCAAMPESLLESELFGYEKGAFSGAQGSGKPGLFEVAENGTIFLDEITELPLGLQAKMLRVLQEKKVRRLGGLLEIAVTARVITATNRNLSHMVENKLFREDLYYRISVFPVYIPPLRNRKEDIPVLVEHFLFVLNSRLEKHRQALSPEAMNKLVKYSWPGNIRELKNTIERASVLCDSPLIGADDVLCGEQVGKVMQNSEGRSDFELGDNTLPEEVKNLEKKYIHEALRQSKSIRQAAKRLGLTHTALLNRIKKYGLGNNRE
ncbi:MAG: sigma 54-interacting transcriptional regulator [Desulfuromonadales bacterium]|nr:sigma 54-interacting transcriptional regulator [Desulfuromonadales bacterium]